MSFTKVYIHFVWSTKNRYPYLNSLELRTTVWEHIAKNAKEKGIYISAVNGFEEHCHCLVSLNSGHTIQYVMQMIKGESAHWINKNGLTKEKFEWQEEYYAAAVSESIIPRVKGYIRKQETHHAKKSYKVEEIEIKEKFGFHK